MEPTSTNRRPHGLPARYRDGCRCDRCRLAYGRHRADRDRLNARLRPELDALRASRGLSHAQLYALIAKQYLLELQSGGLGLRQVARLSGVSRDTLRRIRTGEARSIRVGTVHAICGVRPTLAPGVRVSSRQMRRRLRSLLSYGYSRHEIARLVGLGRLRRRAAVRAKTAARVEALYKWAAPVDG
jgi:transposase-like protein